MSAAIAIASWVAAGIVWGVLNYFVAKAKGREHRDAFLFSVVLGYGGFLVYLYLLAAPALPVRSDADAAPELSEKTRQKLLDGLPEDVRQRVLEKSESNNS